jgi:hypothetical protein
MVETMSAVIHEVHQELQKGTPSPEAFEAMLNRLGDALENNSVVAEDGTTLGLYKEVCQPGTLIFVDGKLYDHQGDRVDKILFR